MHGTCLPSQRVNALLPTRGDPNEKTSRRNCGNVESFVSLESLLRRLLVFNCTICITIRKFKDKSKDAKVARAPPDAQYNK
jgi:hypothetical protein